MRADTLYKTVCEESDGPFSRFPRLDKPRPTAPLATFTIGLLLLLFVEVSVFLKVEVYLLTYPTRKVELGVVAWIHRARSLYVFWRGCPSEVIKPVVRSVFTRRQLITGD